MAYEIINNAQVTPHRLHALVRLVKRLPEPRKEHLFDLLQPRALTENQNAAGNVFRAALASRLVEEDSETKVVRLLADGKSIETVEGFRRHMQGVLLSVTVDTEPNYLFNMFSSWYAAQNERVFFEDSTDYQMRFNRELYPSSEERQFNKDKFTAWSRWAQFLGLCTTIDPGRGGSILSPNAFGRIAPLVNQFLPEDSTFIDFGSFAAKLADLCPELDGGKLFERSWSASHRDEQRGSFSLMLSAGLRQLHDAGRVELIRRADATQNWTLYRAQGHPLQQVTNIRLRANS